jgi:hypothetical protein
MMRLSRANCDLPTPDELDIDPIDQLLMTLASTESESDGDFGSFFANLSEVHTTLEGRPPDEILQGIVVITGGDVAFCNVEKALDGKLISRTDTSTYTANFTVGGEPMAIDLPAKVWGRKRIDPTSVISSLNAKTLSVFGKIFGTGDLGSESVLLCYGTKSELTAIAELLPSLEFDGHRDLA